MFFTLFYFIYLFAFFEAESHYINQAALKLTKISLPLHHHAQLHCLLNLNVELRLGLETQLTSKALALYVQPAVETQNAIQ